MKHPRSPPTYTNAKSLRPSKTHPLDQVASRGPAVAATTHVPQPTACTACAMSSDRDTATPSGDLVEAS